MFRSAFINPDFLAAQEACRSLDASTIIELKIFTIIQLFLFFLLLVIIIKQRRVFHPFFTIFLGIMIISYITIGILALIQVSADYLEIKAQNYSRFLFLVINFIYYFAIPVNVMCTLERLFATFYFRDYEGRRPWFFLVSAFTLGGLFSIGVIANMGDGSTPTFFSTPVQNILYLSSAISLIISFFVVILNIHLMRKNSGDRHSTLTSRYQLTENIKAVRIVLPFIFIDNLITLTDLLTAKYLNVSSFYNSSMCLASYDRYVIVFTGIATIRHLLVLAMPLSILLFNSTIYRPIIDLMKHFFHLRRPKRIANKNEFKNVLGKTITFGQSQDEYFAQLAKSW
ncbi:unnamed protein product, partial [Mesorhabditis belari]|uniref:Gustatory receptor n=1 Tax=Mesorhabditis belari TaxID=2138241 RepID=A0AAF3FSB4_9BILA